MVFENRFDISYLVSWMSCDSRRNFAYSLGIPAGRYRRTRVAAEPFGLWGSSNICFPNESHLTRIRGSDNAEKSWIVCQSHMVFCGFMMFMVSCCGSKSESLGMTPVPAAGAAVWTYILAPVKAGFVPWGHCSDGTKTGRCRCHLWFHSFVFWRQHIDTVVSCSRLSKEGVELGIDPFDDDLAQVKIQLLGLWDVQTSKQCV